MTGSPDPGPASGTRIGTYRVDERLGEGGMGVVYRGHDTKLDRPVAIKFLSSRGADLEARQRFQREAQATSSLNHPNILTVYDAGEHEGRQYLVTELVAGGTLEDWRRAQPRGWRQTVELLTGVADALATAHGGGVLHRDIKPANILLTSSGHAKLADFGLAKLIEGGTDHDTRTALPDHTTPGTILGTVAYMSPEQASGQPLDARSDVFSFGVVLYEALTGQRPFRGATDLEVLLAIREGRSGQLPGDLPVALRAIVEKALEPDPDDRYQSMREMVVDLRRAMRRAGATTAADPAPPESRWRTWPLVAVALLALTAIAWFVTRPVVVPENPFAGATMVRLTDSEAQESDAAISPDGRFVAFLSDRDGQMDVWLTQVDTGSLDNLTGGRAEVLSTPVRGLGFSGDASELWLGGGPDTRLRLLPLVGREAPRPFLDDTVVEVDWSPDLATLVYHTKEDGDPIYLADRTGANARLVVAGTGDHLHQHYPVWSANGEWIYFVGGQPAISRTDLWRIRPSGAGVERLTTHDADVSHPVVLDDRWLLYLASDDGVNRRLWTFDVERRESQPVFVGLEGFTSISASEDGLRVAATIVSPIATLWSVPLRDRLVTDADVTPYALPNVRALAPRLGSDVLYYLSSRGTGDGLWQYRDGVATEVWKGIDGSLLEPAAVSPDGTELAIVLRLDGPARLHVLTADGSRLNPIAPDLDVIGAAAWSPGGEWLVVGGTDDGEPGLFKIPASGGPSERIVTGQARNPVWSPRGDLIVYEGTDVGSRVPLLAVTPDGAPVDLPPIEVRREGERSRFLPDGHGLVYQLGQGPTTDFWLLDLEARTTRRLSQFTGTARMRTFDITPDGGAIVFDRIVDNSTVVLIELPPRR